MEEILVSYMSSAKHTQTLVEQAQAGSRAAFDQLAEIQRPRLEHLVRSRVGTRVRSAIEVEDVVQETLLRAFQAIVSFQWRDEESFVHWLGTIAENVIRGAARKRDDAAVRLSEERVAAETESQGRNLRRDERFDRLQDALDSLDPDSRKVILLARIEGLPIKQVAERRTPRRFFCTGRLSSSNNGSATPKA